MADRWIAAGKRGYICVTGVHGVMEAQTDSEFRHILNRAFLNTTRRNAHVMGRTSSRI